MRISKESWIIAVIGVADLITTIIFIRHHGAQEANPLFKLYWQMGLFAFIVAKGVCLVGPLLILEWASKRNPRFVRQALRSAIVAYLAFYSVGFLKLNAPLANADEIPEANGAVYTNTATIRPDPYIIQIISLQQCFSQKRGLLQHVPSLYFWSDGEDEKDAFVIDSEESMRPFFGRLPFRRRN